MNVVLIFGGLVATAFSLGSVVGASRWPMPGMWGATLAVAACAAGAGIGLDGTALVAAVAAASPSHRAEVLSGGLEVLGREALAAGILVAGVGALHGLAALRRRRAGLPVVTAVGLGMGLVALVAALPCGVQAGSALWHLSNGHATLASERAFGAIGAGMLGAPVAGSFAVLSPIVGWARARRSQAPA